MNDKDLQAVISDFLKNASPEEIREFNELLKNRGPLFGSRVNVLQFAGRMAEQIKRDIGFTQNNIKETARRLVIDLALQYNPDISPEELDALIQEMVPGAKKSGALPKEALLAMVTHFTADAEGAMSPRDAAGLPPGWQKKYWKAFPPKIKGPVARYLSGEISREEMWKEVRLALAGTTG